jgi:hypothetical protein
MALDDVKKIAMITKSSLYEWNVMPFRLKTTTSTFSQTMAYIFKEWINQFVKVLLMMSTYTVEYGMNIYVTFGWFFRNSKRLISN